MSVSDRMKQFRDPLMETFSDRKNDRIHENSAGSERGNTGRVVVGVLLFAVLGVLGYFLYQSQQQIKELNLSLLDSQENLSSVSERLESAQGHLGSLEEGLSKSTTQLTAQKREIGRYQQLYQDLKSQQSNQGRELEAIAVRKADQANVDQLRDRAEEIEGQVTQIDGRMAQVNSNISDLREQTTRNRQDIEGHEAGLASLRTNVDANTQEIAGVKHSLDRDYYNFELQKDAGVIRVFNVALSLKKLDFKNQRFTVEILAGGKKLTKKAQSINEPIYFYVDGVQKPYEVLVSKVDKKFVVGYLSVPKK